MTKSREMVNHPVSLESVVVGCDVPWSRLFAVDLQNK